MVQFLLHMHLRYKSLKHQINLHVCSSDPVENMRDDRTKKMFTDLDHQMPSEPRQPRVQESLPSTSLHQLYP